MHYFLKLLIFVISIFLVGCQSLNHNLIPHNGLTMEQVYDGMDNASQLSNNISQASVSTLQKDSKSPALEKSDSPVVTSLKNNSNEFHKVANPEIKIYLYPHLAGQEQLPVPGYTTAASLYTRDHYVLNNDGE